MCLAFAYGIGPGPVLACAALSIVIGLPFSGFLGHLLGFHIMLRMLFFIGRTY